MTDFKNSATVSAANFLKARGIENAAQEARWLFEHVYGDFGGGDGETLSVSIKHSKRLGDLITRRAGGEPLQYLLGEWEFYGYPMRVGEGVLIPRPETEFLVDAGKEHLAMRKAKLIEKSLIEEANSLSKNLLLLDLCAGSGCVGVAMHKETACRVIGVELSEKALAYAEENIKLNGAEENIRLYNADIFDTELIKKLPQADFIFANPPYLTQKDMEELQTEVAREPASALFGGLDGLDYYRKIFAAYGDKLKPEGLFAVEVGAGQAETVSAFMKAAGFEPELKKDYAGIDRVVYAVKEVGYAKI